MSTPGQIAYATWWRTRYGLEQADAISAYQMLPAQDRRAWDAAAQAAITAWVDAQGWPSPAKGVAGEEEPHA